MCKVSGSGPAVPACPHRFRPTLWEGSVLTSGGRRGLAIIKEGRVEWAGDYWACIPFTYYFGFFGPQTHSVSWYLASFVMVE